MAILTVLSMSSCQDWGEADPPAGNQKLPAKPISKKIWKLWGSS